MSDPDIPTTGILAWIGKVPTTQARVCVTLCIVAATACRYLVGEVWVIKAWAPSYEWLGFLAVMSGLDGLTFASKRVTDSGYVAAKAGTPPDEAPKVDQAVTT